MATSVATVDGRMPEKPRASALARRTIMARTSRSGSGSPTPAAWLRTRLRCRISISAGEIVTSAKFPNPVVRP